MPPLTGIRSFLELLGIYHILSFLSSLCFCLTRVHFVVQLHPSWAFNAGFNFNFSCFACLILWLRILSFARLRLRFSLALWLTFGHSCLFLWWGFFGLGRLLRLLLRRLLRWFFVNGLLVTLAQDSFWFLRLIIILLGSSWHLIWLLGGFAWLTSRLTDLGFISNLTFLSTSFTTIHLSSLFLFQVHLGVRLRLDRCYFTH